MKTVSSVKTKSAAAVMPISSFCASSTIVVAAPGSRPTCTIEPVITGAGTSITAFPSIDVS